MSGCRYPQHHESGRGGSQLVIVLIAVAMAIVVLAVRQAVSFVVAYRVWVCAAAAALFAFNVAKVALLPSGARRYWLPSRWHRLTFKRLARNVGIARVDQHRGGIDSTRKPKVNYPRARFRPDPHGWVVNVKLTHGVSRESFEKASVHLANAWGAHRVGISQPRPNRLQVRAMRRDPLAEPLGSGVLGPFNGRDIVLGRDELGQLRTRSLAGLSGSVIGGNPGRGKSVFGTAIAAQLAPVPTSDWYILDGGGGADWSPWAGRATAFATDNLAEARDVLEDAHARMVRRLATLTGDLGTRNAWTVGPSPDYPLLWVVLDECHQYLDEASAKASGKDAVQAVQAIRSLTGNMLRRGRKVMVHVSLLAQKCTSTSIPPDLRDLAGLRLCFGVATTEAGIAVLGDDLRAYPSLSPTQLQEGRHIGVAVARLANGADPYTRLRVPFVTEDQADAIARETARKPAIPDTPASLFPVAERSPAAAKEGASSGMALPR
jgi:DNA segregation ATPase FtsK/SpoIIIE, S-DNA-T family